MSKHGRTLCNASKANFELLMKLLLIIGRNLLSFAIYASPDIDCNGQRVSSHGTEHDKDCDNHKMDIVYRKGITFVRKALMSGYITDQ